MILNFSAALGIFLITLLPVCTPQIAGGDPELSEIKLPEGFIINFYATDVKGARSMIMGDKGTLFVGSRSAGNVYALVDTNNDNKADKKYIIASGLNSPNGVALKDGNLYVAEISRILRFDDIENRLGNPPKPVVVFAEYPEEGHHGWKYIAFGPDGKLYVPVGAPCNICESAEIFSTITRMDADGSNMEIYASGIRNTVGFDWHPTTGDLWFTDNGRDMMGDDIPPDELNHASRPGMHFGYPYCHGGDIPDPKFGEKRSCSEFTPPAIKLGPHVAALGMTFYTGDMFPVEYKKKIFIAEHGSWNRSTPIGYRVMMVELDGDKAISYQPFAEGWLSGNSAWGRPVDVIMLDDGSLLVSDDHADAIYRISYKKLR